MFMQRQPSVVGVFVYGLRSPCVRSISGRDFYLELTSTALRKTSIVLGDTLSSRPATLLHQFNVLRITCGRSGPLRLTPKSFCTFPTSSQGKFLNEPLLQALFVPEDEWRKARYKCLDYPAISEFRSSSRKQQRHPRVALLFSLQKSYS